MLRRINLQLFAADEGEGENTAAESTKDVNTESNQSDTTKETSEDSSKEDEVL